MPCTLTRLDELLDAFDALDVLVVGDVILDEYLWGDVDRVSPEAPVPVVRVERETRVLGGAGNVARNLAALGARCRLCAVVGDDLAGRMIVDLVKELGLHSDGLVVDADRPTTRKTRVVARNQQMIRADRESLAPLSPATFASLQSRVAEACSGTSGVALIDYGKGTLAPSIVPSLMSLFDEAGLPVAVDPKGELAAYRGAQLAKPNLAEARMLVEAAATRDDRASRPPAPLDLLTPLRGILGGGDVAVTMGRDGMLVCGADRVPRHVPTAPRDVFDVQGAGDTSLAALFLARLAGASLVEAAAIANAAAGVAVTKIGTATASRDELRDEWPAIQAALEESR